MIPLLIDENLSQALTDALREEGVDVARVQDVGMGGTPDPVILEWAAPRGRVFVSLDRDTLPGFAYDRVRASLPMAGVVIVDESKAFGAIVDDLRLIAESPPDDLRDRVEYVPF